ncbi:MAG: CaiB/BaiF CoA transferase family protein [Planctomycetota bacterium]
MADTAAGRPLEGVVVLDLSRILAGPYASQKLGDMGATVWKVELPGQGDDTRAWGPPFHEGISTYFMAVNRSKRSLTLDLKHQDGKRVLGRLIERADVVLENFRAGLLEKLGFGWERIQALNPRAVYASISGYGQVGRHSDRPSFDVIAQGEWGPQDLTGDPAGPPTKFGLSIADITAGQHAVEGILLALLQRARTGRGQRVDVALSDGLLALLTYQAQMVLTGGVAPRRLGNAHPSIVPYQTFATRDGWINVGVGNEGLWAKFCAAAEHPELHADPRYATNRDRVERREELIATLEETFRARDTAEWLERLTAAGIPVGPIRDVPTALEDARTDLRGMVTTVQHPEAGPLTMVGNAVKLSEVGMDPAYLPPPRLGEHTDEILAAAGYGPEEVASLRERGVV